MRLRRYIEVGCAKLSWIEIVGKSIGSPPESMTPRFTASTSCGALPWHGLKALAVLTMPTTGRDSASSEYPAPLMNALRRNSEKPRSP